MFEICRLLAPKPVTKRRKASKPRAKAVMIGSRVNVFCMGVHTGTVVNKRENGWFDVEIDNRPGLHGFARSLLKAI